MEKESETSNLENVAMEENVQRMQIIGREIVPRKSYSSRSSLCMGSSTSTETSVLNLDAKLRTVVWKWTPWWIFSYQAGEVLACETAVNNRPETQETRTLSASPD